ncbi:MAG: hypothetical protein AB1567_04980 [bacterium]
MSKAMQGITLSYTQWHHKKYGSVGYLWQGRFKSMVIERDAYLLECGRYIERNPLRAGIVSDPGKYQWSSYRVYALGEDNNLVDIDPLYESLGKDVITRQKKYKEYVISASDEELRKKIQFQDGGVLGTEDFRREVESRYGIAKRRKRGRPRK